MASKFLLDISLTEEIWNFSSGLNDDHPAAMTHWLIIIIIVKYLYFAHKRVPAPPSVMTVLKWMVAELDCWKDLHRYCG
jgi:hypothetical protein